MTESARIAQADNSLFESGDILEGILQSSKTTTKGFWLHRIDDSSFVGLESLAHFKSDLIRVVVEEPNPTTELCAGKARTRCLRHAPRIRCEGVVEAFAGLAGDELEARRNALRQEAEKLSDVCDIVRDEVLSAYRVLDGLVPSWEGVDGPAYACRKYVEIADRAIKLLKKAADAPTDEIKAHEAEAQCLKEALDPKWNQLRDELAGDTIYYLREEFETLEKGAGAKAKMQYDLLLSLLRQLCRR